MVLKFVKENRDLVNVLSYAAIAMVMVVAIILIFTSISNSANFTTHYDSIAGVDVDNTDTGAMTENLITVIGMDNVVESGINVDVNAASTDVLRQFVTVAYPDADRLSYKKGSARSEGTVYKYEAILDNGTKLLVSVEDFEDGNFLLKITDDRNEILNYESVQYETGKKDPASLGKNLPKTFTNYDPVFSVTQNRNGDYQINIDACGNKDVKAEALKLVKRWVTSLGYSFESFNFVIPNLCDGEG